jgi:hypothetical protein
MVLVYPKTNQPVYQMVFTEPSIAVKKPLHRHFSRLFFILVVDLNAKSQSVRFFDHSDKPEVVGLAVRIHRYHSVICFFVTF